MKIMITELQEIVRTWLDKQPPVITVAAFIEAHPAFTQDALAKSLLTTIVPMENIKRQGYSVGSE